MNDWLNTWFSQLPELNFAQVVGLFSFALGILCFYQKDDRRLKITMVIMSVNHAIHFALLGAVTACLGAVLAVIRTGLSLKTSSKIVAYGFIGLTVLWGAYLAAAWQDMLPIVGSCIGTYSLFCLSGIRMRIGFLFGACFWLANNILIGSIGTTLLEMTLIIVNLSTITRLYFSNPPSSKNPH